MEPKVTIIAKDGKADVEIREGACFHQLNDETQTIFKTSDVGSFKKFISQFSLSSPGESESRKNTNPGDKWTVFAYSLSFDIDLLRMTLLRHQVNYNSEPIAELQLKHHPKFLFLINTASKPSLSIEQMEEMVEVFGKGDGIDKSIVEFREKIRDLRISSVTEIVRQKDNRGNYQFTVNRKVGGQDKKSDVVFPEKLIFVCPLFLGSDFLITLSYDLYFDFKQDTQDDSRVVMKWYLKNYDADEQIVNDIKTFVDGYFVDYNLLWGGFDIKRKNDSWKYLANPSRE